MATWKTFMQPAVARRLPLSIVAQWWAECYAWRTSELAEGRGTPYDFDPSSRVPRSTARAKFPWLDLNDETELVPLVRAEARRRGFKELLREIRRSRTDERGRL